MMNPENEPNGPEDPRRPLPGANIARNKYTFTPEELRVLKECNKDSFYQRCIPISAALAASTYYGVQTGFLKGHQRFGATPKVIFAVFIGYFLGKFSYQSKCAERLMQLPNSQIGEMLRQKRKGHLHESLDSGFGPGMSLAPFSGVNSTDTYSDLNPNSSLDLDTDRPENKGLDDHNRPSMDNQIYEDEMPPEQKHNTSYDELRKKNREEYQQKRIGNYREPFTPGYSGAPPGGSFSGSQSGFSDDVPAQPKNKYGDAWG
ncbi:unnamed protein product [Phaedon cochleariae]|uniref:OCIA domain-containing protein n=1 Tax=Phaedon cochleariae TaxID=80249 RepID=A0A9P0GSE7_PHACE|nr:unnamed protein product [Phaedon cochleariae]